MSVMIPPGRKLFFKESVGYRSSVSEYLLYTLAAMCNFLNLRHIETKRFTINGVYSPSVFAAYPINAIDGIHVFEFDSEITNIWIYNRQKGTAGTTTLDIKWKANDSTVWESIFAGVGGAQPAFTNAASNYETCGIGDEKAGFTAPAPTKLQFNAKDAIRLDLIAGMTGLPSGCGLIINYRPR